VTTLGRSLSGPGLELPAQKPEPLEHGGEEAAEKWAGLLAASVMAQLPPPSPPRGLSQEAPTADTWRSGDGSLTPARAAAPEAGSDLSGRIALSVDGADLGELSVLVDRTNQGVRVLIGVQGEHAAAAIDPQTAALVRALTAVGVTVSSVTVVRREPLGTDLAQRSQRPPPTADDSSEQHGAHGAKQRKRRINLFG
jgi:hypothetical protein